MLTKCVKWSPSLGPVVQRYDKLLFSLRLCVCVCVCVCLRVSVCVCVCVCVCLALTSFCFVQSEARGVHSLSGAALCYQAAPLT